MKELSQKDMIDYLYNCYVKVDGLWFVKIEEEQGFEKTLALDAEVWKVMPKIQARFLKEKLMKNFADFPGDKLGTSQKGCSADPVKLFLAAIKVKLTMDRFKFKIIKKPDIITVEIIDCPWHNILIKSGRENLSDRIGSIICTTEYAVFAREFISDIKLKSGGRICRNNKSCSFSFEI